MSDRIENVREHKLSNDYFDVELCYNDTHVASKRERVKIDKDGLEQRYVILRNGTVWWLEMHNKCNTRADVSFKVDGEELGTLVPQVNAVFELRRDLKVDKAFVFVIEDRKEARALGVRKGASDNGLVEITFVAHNKEPKHPVYHRHIHHKYDRPRDDHIIFNLSASFAGESSSAGAVPPMASMHESKSLGSAPRESMKRARVPATGGDDLKAGATVRGDETGQTFGVFTDDVTLNETTRSTFYFRLVGDDSASDDPNKPVLKAQGPPPRLDDPHAF